MRVWVAWVACLLKVRIVRGENHSRVNLTVAVLHTATLVSDCVRRGLVLRCQCVDDETFTLTVNDAVDGTGRSDLGAGSFAHAN